MPEATMAQRISRAKRTVSAVRFDEPGDLATVLRVLYLVFNEGYSGEIDLADEAIRLTRQVTSMTDDEEASGLLAPMLLHRARRAARTAADGALVPLAEQDRSRWDIQLITEGVAILRTALARDRLGEYQAQAAIAALHADARTVDETDWVQIVEWYDELVRLTDNPVGRVNRAVAVGEADGPQAGLTALAEVDRSIARYAAVEAYPAFVPGVNGAIVVARVGKRTLMERYEIADELAGVGAQELLTSTPRWLAWPISGRTQPRE